MSGLVWLLRLPGSSSSGVSPGGWLCGNPQRQPGGWSIARPDGQQQVSTTGGGQCGKYRRSSWESLWKVSLVPLCHGSQWRVHHTGLSWAGAAPTHILESCLAHRNCDISNMASMLMISAWSRTSTLETWTLVNDENGRETVRMEALKES